MSKPVKNMITRELSSRYGELDSALWIELVGADGVTTNLFRRELHGQQMRLEMVKNSLLRRAVADSPLSRLAKEMSGPSALVTGGESVIDVAKIVEQWMPKLKGMKLRGAMLEGEYLDESQVGGLASMPNRADMLARIAGMALSPGSKIASAVQSAGGNIAGCLKSIIEKLEKNEAPAA